MKLINKKIMLVMTLNLIALILFSQSVASENPQLVYGYISYSDGSSALDGASINVTNRNTSHSKIVNTVGGEGIYSCDITGEDGNEIWINVSQYGNTGNSMIILNNSEYTQYCNITISGNEFPNADFSFDISEPNTDETIQFTDKSTDPEESTASNWTWDFGDGTTSNEQNPKHKYSINGTYQVTLTATDSYGAPSTKTTTINVEIAPEKPDEEDNSTILIIIAIIFFIVIIVLIFRTKKQK